jgi:hypothetical protein
MFLRNVGWLLTDYSASYSKERELFKHRFVTLPWGVVSQNFVPSFSWPDSSCIWLYRVTSQSCAGHSDKKEGSYLNLRRHAPLWSKCWQPRQGECRSCFEFRRFSVSTLTTGQAWPGLTVASRRTILDKLIVTQLLSKSLKVQWNPSLDAIMNQLESYNTITYYFLKIHFNIILIHKYLQAKFIDFSKGTSTCCYF